MIKLPFMLRSSLGHEEGMSAPLLTQGQGAVQRLLQCCLSCFTSESPSSQPDTELSEIKIRGVPKLKPSYTPPDLRSEESSTDSQALSSSSTKKKRKKSKKGLLITNSVVEGMQLLGSGKETVVVIVKSIPIELPKVSSFRLDIRNKPKYVPMKYWNQRYSIFSKFDSGIQLDEESWYSVTHEPIAKHISDVCKEAKVVMDGFAGAGGNVIQFAHNFKTIGVEIDPARIEMLKNNAKIYGVENNINCVQGDFLQVAKEQGPIDVIFMSPPWGGPDYVKSKKYNIFAHITPDITKIMEVCNEATKSIILYMPRTVNPAQIVQLFKNMPNVERKVEFQLYCFGDKVKTVGCIMGEIVKADSNEIAKLMLDRMKIPKFLPKDKTAAIVAFSQEISENGFNQSLVKAYANKKPSRSRKNKAKLARAELIPA